MAKKNLIVAHAEHNVIGYRGSMPWEGQLPADMKHFREKTMGKAVLMGRITHESIGMPLPKRRNVVLTRNQDLQPDSRVEVARSLHEAYALLEDEELFIIGGQKVYEATINDVDKMYITYIRERFLGDTYFPGIDEAVFALTSLEHHLPDRKNAFAYEFREYERKG